MVPALDFSSLFNEDSSLPFELPEFLRPVPAFSEQQQAFIDLTTKLFNEAKGRLEIWKATPANNREEAEDIRWSIEQELSEMMIYIKDLKPFGIVLEL